jgi:hypothetical protein
MSIPIAKKTLRGLGVKPSLRLYQYQPNQILPLVKYHLPASILLWGILATPCNFDPHIPDVKIWSTIPKLPDDAPIPLDSEGTIILEIISKSGNHLRVFDTLESQSGREFERLGEGEERVVQALRASQAQAAGVEHQIGGLHERWILEVVDKLGDGVAPIGQGVWLPPREWKPDSDRVEGYIMDIGREEDVESVSKTRQNHH